MSAANRKENKRVNLDRCTNFMRQFRDPESRELTKLSANQFMDVWSHYDKDGKHFDLPLANETGNDPASSTICLRD
jgi:hypothetical protein